MEGWQSLGCSELMWGEHSRWWVSAGIQGHLLTLTKCSRDGFTSLIYHEKWPCRQVAYFLKWKMYRKVRF